MDGVWKVSHVLRETPLLDLIKEAKAKWMQMLPTLSSSSASRIGRSMGVSTPKLHALEAGSRGKGMQAALRGGNLQRDAATLGLHRGEEGLTHLPSMRSADELAQARARMTNVPVSTESVALKNRMAGSAARSGKTELVHEPNMGLYQSHARDVNYGWYKPEARIGTQDLGAVQASYGPIAERSVTAHELGELRGMRNAGTKDWHRVEANADLRQARLPKDIRRQAGRHISSEQAPLPFEQRTNLNTPISMHVSSAPLASEYASTLGVPGGGAYLKSYRSMSGEGVQSGLFRQYGMTTPHSAQRAYSISPSQDARLTRRISGEYGERVKAMQGGGEHYLPDAPLMNDARFRQARLLNRKLPTPPPAPNIYGADAFQTGSFPAFKG